MRYIASFKLSRLSYLLLVPVVLISQLLQIPRLSHADAPPSGSNYTSISPQRLFDTRDAANQPLRAGTTITRAVSGGHGVPAAGVSAVMVNLTVVSPTTSGYVTAYAAGSQRPITSNVNYPTGATVSNQSLVQLNSNGALQIYASATTQLIVDIVGWLSPPAAGTSSANIVALTPVRLADSRTSLGGIPGAFAKGETRQVRVAGVGAIPADAQGVFLNLTSIAAQKSGEYVTVYPSSATRPVASSVTQSQLIVANQVFVPIDSDGMVFVYSSWGPVQIVLDIQGYVTTGDGSVASTSPRRILDSRTALGGQNGQPLAANQTLKLPVAGISVVPANVETVFVHVTAVNRTNGGHATVAPSGGVPSQGSTMNYASGATVSATASVKVGANGAIAITNAAGATHMVVDILGWTLQPLYSVTAPRSDLLALALPSDAASTQSRAILNNANKYAMTTWWNGDGQTLLNTPLNYSLNAATGGGTDPVRRLSNQAYGTATALALNTYDANATGVSRQIALQRTITIIDYVARNHLANTANGWGSGWQSSFWAGYTARAAWLIWPQLSAQDQQYVAKMIRFEANDTAGKSIHYLRDANGSYTGTTGDTGSDDTSWWGMPMQIAAQMLPNDVNAPIWKHGYVQFALAAWGRPSDVTSTTSINGKPLSSWIRGSNVGQNGIVTNHERIAPDYMTLTYQTTDDIWLNALAGQPAPLADKALIANVYNAYTSVNFPSGTYAAPGGTIYDPTTANIYYPQGIDWGTGQQLPYALVDTNAVAYGLAAPSANRYQLLHGQAQLNLQSRFSDGRTYGASTEYRYAGREEQISQLAAEMLLANYVSGNNLVSFHNNSYALRNN